jgi:gamma-glutamyltranspeptidase/glutathione hydrolase
LASCGPSKPVGTIGFIQGFGGMVATDEPRAALVARDILSAGGTAADAAVSLYFTMAVTQPSTASLGGGGVCVVHDRDKKKTEVVEFFAPAASGATQSRTPNAVPANVRGFYALHAKYGSLRWESLLNEAERLARMGTPVSRAFAADLARGAQALAADPAARRIFLPQGKPLAEGQNFEQLDLAATLARIRRGAGDFYVGGQSRELIQAVASVGGTLTAEDLRDLKPQYRDALTVKLGTDIAHFAPPPAVAGAVAAQITAALADQWKGASDDERPHLLAEASARAFAERSRWMQPHGWPNDQGAGLTKPERVTALMAGYSPERHATVQAAKPTEALPAAGFVVMDSFGGAVACNVTTYGLFGNGKVAPGTGIVLAAAPGLTSGPAAIGPVLVVNPHVHEVHLAAAASGGITAPTALAQTVLATMVEGRKLDAVMNSPRIHHSGQPDFVAVESGDHAGDPAPLSRRGHEVKSVPIPSRVNAFQCDSGAPSFFRCRVASDPRGHGLAAVVGKD